MMIENRSIVRRTIFGMACYIHKLLDLAKQVKPASEERVNLSVNGLGGKSLHAVIDILVAHIAVYYHR